MKNMQQSARSAETLKWIRRGLTDWSKPTAGRQVLAIFAIFLASWLVETFLFRSRMRLDLFTPFLVHIAVNHRLRVVLPIAALASLLLETTQSCPVGTYFSIYLSLVLLIHALRDSLSLGSMSNWLLLFGLTSAAVIAYEWMIYLLLTRDFGYEIQYAAENILRLLSAVAFGGLLAYRQLFGKNLKPVGS